MGEQKLHSGMTCKEIQDYCEAKVKPTAKNETIDACDLHSETLMLTANLTARIKELNA